MSFYQYFGYWSDHTGPNLWQNNVFIGPGAFIPFLFPTLILTITALLEQERFLNVLTKPKALYIVGICHGFAVACLLQLIYDNVILITNGHNQVANLEVCWRFLASYLLSLALCNAIVNWSCKLVAIAATDRARTQVRMEGVLKEGVPTIPEIAALALYIVEIWKRLGRALGIEEAIIAQIRMNEEDVYERAYIMLTRWRQKMGAQANYEALAQALGCEEIGRVDLIQQFCYAVEPQGAANNQEDGAAA